MNKAISAVVLATVFVTGAFAAGDAKAGKDVYEKSCKSCHGVAGTANPAIAKMMKVDMKDLGSPEVQGLSDDNLKKVIADGQGKMKPIKTVSGKAADDVVAYVRTLKK
jgi:mono/diheme cytochrome c family protein